MRLEPYCILCITSSLVIDCQRPKRLTQMGHMIAPEDCFYLQANNLTVITEESKHATTSNAKVKCVKLSSSFLQNSHCVSQLINKILLYDMIILYMKKTVQAMESVI